MSSPETVGLIAGWGTFPIDVARTLRAQGRRVVCLGIQEHADPQFAELCDDFRWIGIARVGGMIRYFRKHGATKAVMAGKIFKDRLLYHGWGWMSHIPDWRAVRDFYPFFLTNTRDRKDDSILGAVVDCFAKDGIDFVPATDLVPELLVQYGILVGKKPGRSQRLDIDFGWQLAKQMGDLDVGQTVVVKGRSTIAVEAVEGTDRCIQRAGEICPQGGFVVVKVAKPQQDMRFDVPTIGLGTIQQLIEAKAALLAIEAEKTIVLDQEKVVAHARRHGLQIVAVRDGQVDALDDETSAAA